MAKGQKSQLVTKKHLARQERERRQNRYILIASIAVIVIVVGLIGYGIVQQYIIAAQTTGRQSWQIKSSPPNNFKPLPAMNVFSGSNNTNITNSLHNISAVINQV